MPFSWHNCSLFETPSHPHLTPCRYIVHLHLTPDSGVRWGAVHVFKKHLTPGEPQGAHVNSVGLPAGTQIARLLFRLSRCAEQCAEWNPGDYAMELWFSRIQTAPQATTSWRRCGSRFSRWSQSHAGFESVNLLQHPVRAKRTSKIWLMWLRIIPSFQRCTVLWEKSPLSVRKLCKNSCNGNYETPCICDVATQKVFCVRFFCHLPCAMLSVDIIATFLKHQRIPILPHVHCTSPSYPW